MSNSKRGRATFSGAILGALYGSGQSSKYKKTGAAFGGLAGAALGDLLGELLDGNAQVGAPESRSQAQLQAYEFRGEKRGFESLLVGIVAFLKVYGDIIQEWIKSDADIEPDELKKLFAARKEAWLDEYRNTLNRHYAHVREKVIQMVNVIGSNAPVMAEEMLSAIDDFEDFAEEDFQHMSNLLIMVVSQLLDEGDESNT